MKIRVLCAVNLLFLVLFILAVPSLSRAQVSPPAWAENEYGWTVSGIELEAIKSHVVYLSSLGSRITGYPGADRAAEYIYNKFVQYGLVNVSYQSFDTTVPMDYGASLTILTPMGVERKTIALYSFWPNMVAPVKTSPGGLAGRLVYIGDGTLAEMDGKLINGSIVLMNLNTQYRWLDAAKFGAKAVLFIQSETDRQEVRTKITAAVPFNFPRLLIKEEDANVLLQLLKRGEVTVRLDADMRWERREGRNIIAQVPGSLYKDKYVMITSHYDSFSFVPTLDPGAQSACGVATLLEMAKFFKAHPPKHSLVLVAYSGTYQGLQGSTKFVEENLIKNYDTFGKNVVLVLNMDLNTYTSHSIVTTIGLQWQNWFNIAPWAQNIIKYEREIRQDIENKLGKTFTVDTTPFITVAGGEESRYWIAAFGMFWPPLDHESFLEISAPGISWVTAHAQWQDFGTWQDIIEKMNFENLKEQLELIYPQFYTFANTEDLRPQYVSDWSPTYGGEGRWVDIRVQLAEYAEGWYKPIPNALFVLIPTSVGAGTFAQFVGPFAQVYMTDGNGTVEIHGVSQKSHVGIYHLSGYKVDPETGNIVYGPDYGKYAFRAGGAGGGQGAGIGLNIGTAGDNTMQINLARFYDLGIFTLFKCGSLVAFDVDDPYHSNAPILSTQCIINDLRTHNPPDHYGIATEIHEGVGSSLMMVFIPPDVPVEAMLSHLKFPFHTLLGYTVEDYGMQEVLTYTLLKNVQQMHNLNEERARTLATRAIYSPSIQKHEEVKSIIESAQEDLERSEYSRSYALAGEALALEREVYIDLRTTFESTVYTIPFFGLVIVPFVFAFERLVFHQEGLKRLFALIGIYAILVAALYSMHPGFVLATDSPMIMLMSVILILTLPIFAIIFQGFGELVNSLRRKIRGEHFVEVSKGASLVMSFDIAIRYMKRRRSRTTLVLLTLVIVVAALVPFMSFSAVTFTKVTTLKQTGAPYDGIMVKNEQWGAKYSRTWRSSFTAGVMRLGIGERVVQQIQTMYGEDIKIAPRAWVYHGSERGDVETYLFTEMGQTFEVFGLLGLTSQEGLVSGLNNTLISGRWFVEDDTYACVISNRTANRLGVTSLPFRIYLGSVPLQAVGIVSDQMFDSKTDLDGEALTPLDFRVPNPNFNIHLPVEYTLIIPYDLALRWNGMIKSVAIRVEDKRQTPSLTEAIFQRFRLYTYAGIDGKVLFSSEGNIYVLMGLEFKIPPLILTSLTILNLMIASIYERRKDIETFSIVGLNPLEVAFLFLYEAIVYALVSSILGYVLSIFAVNLSSLFMPRVAMNYASSMVLNALYISMAATIISSIYPLIRSAKLVTPSLERKWKPPTKPSGDVWEIPFPYKCDTDWEALGMLSFIHEYVKDHTTEQSDSFFAREYKFEEKTEDAKRLKMLVMRNVSLAPYELGVKQDVTIVAMKDPETNRHLFSLLLERKSGERMDWETFNLSFIDTLRKQVLLWTSTRVRQEYMKGKIEI